jgi:hypothetical protein
MLATGDTGTMGVIAVATVARAIIASNLFSGFRAGA